MIPAGFSSRRLAELSPLQFAIQSSDWSGKTTASSSVDGDKDAETVAKYKCRGNNSVFVAKIIRLVV